VEVDAWLGVALVHVVRGRRSFVGVPGETVSLLAHGGPATGVTTTGLRWAMDAGVLDPGSSLGVSNVLVAEAAQVEVATGCVVVVRPGPEPAPSAHPLEVGR
jgi:thiamine pyrophosphokinase